MADEQIEYDEDGIAKTVIDNRNLGVQETVAIGMGRVRTPVGEIIVADQPVPPGPSEKRSHRDE